MMQLRLSESARSDIDDIFNYISARNPYAADRWADEIRDRLILLATQPMTGLLVEHRELETRRIAYRNWLVFYRPEPRGVLVLRVLHGRRDLAKIKLT